MRLRWLMRWLALFLSIIYLQAHDDGGIGNCVKLPLNCTYFCDKDLPLVNRSSSGAFETDYLTSIRFKPLKEMYTHRHTVFDIPGIKPHCLELSLRCGTRSHYRKYNSTLPVKLMYTLQLSFRCEHTVVKYLMYYQSQGDCYMIALDHMNHKKDSACNIGQTRPCQLLGDGYHYLLLLYCFKHVFGRELRENAYWLFVNKRNTPEQNGKIMQQLALPNPLQETPSYRRTDASGNVICRCDIFHRYIHEIRQCHRPFLQPGTEHAGQRLKDDEPDITVKLPSVSGVGLMTSEQWNWFLVKCVLVVGAFGAVSFTLYIQLERRVEEQLAEGNVHLQTDAVRIKFIKVQESVDSET